MIVERFDALALAAMLLWNAQAVLAGEGDAAAALRTECAARAAAGEGMTITGRDGFLFLRSELRHVGAGDFWGDAAQEVNAARKAEHRDPLEAILDTNESLKNLGIELLVMPVPAKALAYADKLSDVVKADDRGTIPRLDTVHQAFLKLLAEKGVQVIDLMPALLEERTQAGDPLYCRTDSHWSGRACRTAAGLLAGRIKAKAWYADVTRKPHASQEREVQIKGDLLSGLATPDAQGETLKLRFVNSSTPEKSSPVLLLGDSHCLVFHAGGDMLAGGAGLADQLAFELGFAVDVLGVRGSGARPARIGLYRRAKQPGYIKGKKVVIWCFAVREFSEAAWGKVPVVKKGSGGNKRDEGVPLRRLGSR